MGRTVHSLISGAFLGPPAVGLEINHVDGNKQNNRLENLEYVTRGENESHAHRLGLKTANWPSYRGEDHPGAKLTCVAVTHIRLMHASSTWSTAALARHFGVTPGCIRKVLSGETWAHVVRGAA